MENNDQSFQLGQSQREVLGLFIDSLIHRAVDLESKPELNRVVEQVEDFISGLPALHRWGVKMLMRLLDLGPVVWGYRHQFSNLEHEDRVSFLKAFESHDSYGPRAMMLALKSMVLVIYFSMPEIEQGIGYDHNCLLDVSQARTGE